jgi:Tol biopolymer transport system component
MRRKSTWVPLFAIAALVIPAPAIAAYPGANGRIAFSSDRGGDFAIWTMAADGSDARQLTVPSAPFFDRVPAWSPDGRHIAFSRGAGTTSQVWVVNADGSGATQLTSAQGHNGMPTWSPDGRWIAFASTRASLINNPDIWVMNADGTDPRRLTTDPGAEEFPAWSPLGDRILFSAQFDSPDALWTVTPDGATLAPFGPATASVAADWSPDGSKVVVDGPEVSLIDAGSGVAQPLLPPGNFYPAWSPDGARIVYAHGSTGTDIWTVKPDGTDQAPVAVVPGEDDQPDWQPVSNRPPDCSGVYAVPASLWPPNHTLVTVSVSGATDPDGDTVTLRVTSVAGGGNGDAVLGPAPNEVRLRAERDQRGARRTYRVAFTAADAMGASCDSAVDIAVAMGK